MLQNSLLNYFQGNFRSCTELSSHFFVVNYCTVIHDISKQIEQRALEGKIFSRSVAFRDSYN